MPGEEMERDVKIIRRAVLGLGEKQALTGFNQKIGSL